MNYLITGASGFVGTHLIKELSRKGHTIHGVDIHPPAGAGDDGPPVAFHQTSLADYTVVKSLLEEVRPERIIHLASASSVALSWEAPVDCFINNTNIFLNLVEALRKTKIPCRVLSVGSSEEYGIISEGDMPVAEGHPLDPVSPYAVARVAQEHLSRVYVRGYGLDIVCTRSFNHMGPGQTDRFVVSSFVKQAVEVAQGKKKEISCGRMDITRDFVDVRDVMLAYDIILDRGKAGEVYNVCTGKGYSLKEVLEHICRQVKIPFAARQQDSLLRPIDNRIIVGDNRKLKELGFSPRHDLSESLESMIEWWHLKV